MPHSATPFAATLLATVIAACGGGDDSATPPVMPPLACLALPEITWFRGERSNDWSDVLIDGRNRIWLAGYADGDIGQRNIEPSGNSRAVLRQLAPDGSLLWDSGQQFDSAGTDVAEALALTPQGMVVVAGRTTGAFGGAPNAGQFDTFLAWSEAPGSAAPWRLAQFGSARPQHPRRLAMGADGDLHLAGYDDDYIPSNYVEAWSDPFALRLRRQSAGTASEQWLPLWQHSFGTEAPDVVDGLAVEAGGANAATYISGAVQSGAQRGMFVRKLDATGNLLWTARYTAVGLDHIVALKMLPDGQLLMAGTVFGAFRDGVARGQQDVFVARIAADDGRVLASSQYGSAESDWLTDMQVDANGNILLLGETSGSVVPGQANAGLTDIFMLKLAPDGRQLAARQWGTANDEGARRLALDSCGRVLAVGNSTAGGRRVGVMWFWQP
jgi:hypothetical protein